LRGAHSNKEMRAMFILKILSQLFLLPGDIVRRRLNITTEQDGGILRSFINMVFWGAVLVWVILLF